MKEPKEKLKPLLKPNLKNKNRASQPEKVESKLTYGQSDGIASNYKSVNQLLVLHGITSHIRIHIEKQDEAQLVNKFNSETSNELSSKNCIQPVRKVYHCPICPSHVELSPGLLSEHLTENHKSTNLLKCSFPKCEFSTWVSHFLKTHLANVHHQLPFLCPVCPKKCKTASHLRVHMLSHAPAESKKYICPRPNCEYACHYPKSLKDHLQSSHDLELKYKCPHCSWRTKYENSIAVHVEKSHKDAIKPKTFKCPQDQCHFAADKLSKVKQHSCIHSDHKPFKCHLCNFSTKHRNSIKNHLVVHSGLKPFECNLCGKKMRTNTHLKDHLRRHLGEKPFKCPDLECSFVAATRGEIKSHDSFYHSKDGASEIKSFKCPLCTKAFHRNKNLNAHIKTHTREKPFSCKFCSRDFGTTSSKVSHERRCKMRLDGTKIKPYRCEFCEKTFIRTQEKFIHERTCKARPDGIIIRPFKCPVDGCSFAASQRCNLKHHSKRLH